MTRKARLDAELVRRGLARSRQDAVDLVNAGRVKVAGMPAQKAATAVDAATPLVVATGTADDSVSRGAHKLTGALDAWPGLAVAARRCLDAGASTGGFTQVLLRRGAREVVAVDVGYGQLAWSLASDERVRVLDRTNVRTLTPAHIDGAVDLVVADLSFISLTVVLEALAGCLVAGGDLVVMVKPQFEAGRDAVGSGGVVRDPMIRAAAVSRVAAKGWQLGLGAAGVVASPLPGPAGNVEYFLWLRSDAHPLDDSDLARALAVGPQ
ncbi:MAG TPA: TlyA family RNA methyltransferase [Mycobacteriales bacterium]|nr:TlyA family RNA methyltransferase [Mycobacteriales bacterium]